MPIAGSQIILCDLPMRFDNYKGCTHKCAYCFVQRNNKNTFDKIEREETPKSLENFIKGYRNQVNQWCDWDIPIHWGGMSDPFQPIEREKKWSLECLQIFKETQYPFVVSTKNAMIAEEPYLQLIKECNCVVQISASCDEMDKIETGASSFQQRMEAVKKITPFKRVNIRCQPYIPKFHEQIKKNIKLFSEYGVHGVIFESMKYQKKVQGTIKLAGDFVYPTKLLIRQFRELKALCHRYGMKFYCGENRLRKMSDELCCCGIEGMGWKPNTANLNHFLFDKKNYKFTKSQKQKGSTMVFKSCLQEAGVTQWLKEHSYEEVMERYTKDKTYVSALLPDGTIK